jgi:proline iminopeptidase
MPKPASLPFHDGYLPVGGRHELYVAQYGRADASASLVLHGGPGSGCKLNMLDWFDLAQDRVVLLDQRGAGRSRPGGETGNNRTADLVEDIERVRTHLGLGRVLLVGGSWGGTLALCYAGHYPDAVRGLVLRGVFLASRREAEWFFQDLRAMVPVGWQELTVGWTALQKRNVLQTLIAQLQNVPKQEQREAAHRWGKYEEAVMQAMSGRPAAAVEFDPAWLAKYRIQAHYLGNACFTSPRRLFRCAQRAAGIPAILLHGTRDWICPPENALRLARFMPHAQLRWVANGTHAPSDPAILEALRQAIRDLQDPAPARIAHDPPTAGSNNDEPFNSRRRLP